MNKPYFTKYILEFNPGSEVPIPKPKLFLCSRDIQVGDTAKFKFYDGEKDTLCDNIGMVMSAKNYDAYKVIGEVSPNAIWVKEGMEFDKDEVRPQPTTMFADEHNYWSFKCPNCNTFH